MTLKFGTDGVRGPAGELTDDLVAALGTAAARVLGAERFVIGRDTRESGPRLEQALRRGIEVAGVAVDLLGVVPTPAVACLADREGAAGAVISAARRRRNSCSAWLRVRVSARSNSRRASVGRANRASRSPRTDGSRW